MAIADLSNDSLALSAANLLTLYNFELGNQASVQLVLDWLDDYPAIWIRSAVIEALYQGRYKAISVEQILACWSRRGQILLHFNLEFERIICSQFLCQRPLQSPISTVKSADSEDLSTPNQTAGVPNIQSFPEHRDRQTSEVFSLNVRHQHLRAYDSDISPQNGANEHRIPEFVPIAASPGLHTKLRAVAQHIDW